MLYRSIINIFVNLHIVTSWNGPSALAAADNAVMLLDAAKGLEPQTRKLFEVVRMRSLPLCKLVQKSIQQPIYWCHVQFFSIGNWYNS